MYFFPLKNASWRTCEWITPLKPTPSSPVSNPH